MNIELDDFNGPLDLLLHLVKVNKMDIYNINIEGAQDMDLLNININNKSYDYIDSICIGNKFYIVYGDGKDIYVCGYDQTDNSTYVISDIEFEEVKKRLKLNEQR